MATDNNINNEILTAEEVIASHASESMVRREKLAQLKEAGACPFEITKVEVDAYAKTILENYADYEAKEVKMAGRIMSKRIMGKASFSHIYDGTAKIQLYFKSDTLGESYEFYKTLDTGDIISFTGEVFTTRHGEISVKVDSFKLTAKSLNP
ncbi:MAG: OB-fold nucleic acid binding domain-containing protein, partial [Firmicutes bacterium]|nr:OB-fold nucleic acid binding domain-containing protein [Bacillota bacterium]